MAEVPSWKVVCETRILIPRFDDEDYWDPIGVMYELDIKRKESLVMARMAFSASGTHSSLLKGLEEIGELESSPRSGLYGAKVSGDDFETQSWDFRSYRQDGPPPYVRGYARPLDEAQGLTSTALRSVMLGTQALVLLNHHFYQLPSLGQATFDLNSLQKVKDITHETDKDSSGRTYSTEGTKVEQRPLANIKRIAP